MKTIAQSLPSPQAPARSGREILRALQHPLALAAARLEWLAADDERDAAEAQAIGNNAIIVPFLRLRASALRVAAQECRAALRCGYAAQGEGYGQALALLQDAADQLEARAQDEAKPCDLSHLSPAALAQMKPYAGGQDLIAAAYHADAELLRFAASVLGRETPPRLRDLADSQGNEWQGNNRNRKRKPGSHSTDTHSPDLGGKDGAL